MPKKARAISAPLYGMKNLGDLFTPRQLVALTTFSDLVQEARERVKATPSPLACLTTASRFDAGGTGATAYADAVAVYLAFAVSKAR